VTERDKGPGEEGYALLSAIWALAILMIIVTGLIARSASGVRAAHDLLRRSQARAYGQAVLLQSIVDLQSVAQWRRPRVDGFTSIISVLGASQKVTIQLEYGRIDLNEASIATLASLFASVGATAARAEALAAVVDRRRRGLDFVRSPSAAPPIQQPFQMVSELLNVKFMTRSLFNAVEPALTVYNGRDQVMREAAPYPVLRALPGVSAAEAQQEIRERESDMPDRNSGSALVKGRVRVGSDIRGWPFLIEAQFGFENHHYQIQAVEQPTGTDNPPALTSAYRFQQIQ
jgi:general secretion pathway protein K